MTSFRTSLRTGYLVLALATAACQPPDSNMPSSPPISGEESRAIQDQIMRSWQIPKGVPRSQDMAVTLSMELAQDGSVMSIALSTAQKERYRKERLFRQMADSAMSAVRRASPLQGLAAHTHASWRQIELIFDPTLEKTDLPPATKP